MKRKVILTCAVTGNAPFNPKHPNFPVTPAEICDSAVEAAAAGASVVHLHVRDPETGEGSFEPALFREVVNRVRQTGVDIVINVTCGGGALFLPDPEDEGRALPESDMLSAADRVRHIEDTLPEICSLDVTTGNQVEGEMEFVYLNTTRTLRAMAKRFQEIGVKPEMEVFQMGDILFANQLVKEGLIDGPPLYQMVLVWAGFGIARMEMPMAAQAVLLGGNVRVGLEDNLYLERGVFASNGQLVERAGHIIEHLGCDVATPAETRDMLNLKVQKLC